MQIKKFEAPTIQEALDAIKRELGPEAIIMQTKKNKKGFGLLNGASVEVTAAISDRSMQKKTFSERKLPDAKREELARMPAGRHADMIDKAQDREQERLSARNSRAETTSQRRYADIDSHEMEVAIPSPYSRPASARNAAAAAPAGASTRPNREGTLEDEVKHLKRMIEEIKIAQDERPTSADVNLSSRLMGEPALLDAFEVLILNGVDKRYALSLVKKASFELGPTDAANPDTVLDQIAFELMGSVETLPALSQIQPRQMIALVGPTGVGKTTTLAKIASQALLQKELRVGFINLDVYKIAAFDQLATYAKILNVPFRSASNAEELATAVKDFEALDLILLDTTGRSPKDLASLKEMSDMLRSLERPVQTHLVLSASTRDTELYDTAHRFSVFKPSALVLSKLDEATIYGSIYNACQKAKLPLSFFTTGQRVPEDLEEASRERLAALILDL